MSKVFLVNAFTQEVKALYLDNLSENEQEIIDIAREYPSVVGKVDEDLILRVVKNKSLSIKIENNVYPGGIFIIASSTKVDNSNLLHIPLYKKITFNTAVAREIIRLARKDYYTLDDQVQVSFNQQISIREFIKKTVQLSDQQRNEMYRILYSANSDFTDDGSVYTIAHFMKRYVR